MLVTGDTILTIANEENFAVPAFNMSDYAMFEGIADLCEDLRAPWIVNIHPLEYGLNGPDFVKAVINRARRSSVPMTVHLDHGETHAEVVKAIQDGYTSVMIDASQQPFARNVEITKDVVRTAHQAGISVEGELGTIGSNDSYGESGAPEVIYTVPEDAVRFVEETRVDSLAIAIGTFHGFYPEGITPKIDLDLLRRIKAAVPLPLVLHGGSGNPDDEIRAAARSGINKVNISSDIKVAFFRKLRKVLADGDRRLREPFHIYPAVIPAMQEVAAQKLDLLGTTGRADLYR